MSGILKAKTIWMDIQVEFQGDSTTAWLIDCMNFDFTLYGRPNWVISLINLKYDNAAICTCFSCYMNQLVTMILLVLMNLPNNLTPRNAPSS